MQNLSKKYEKLSTEHKHLKVEVTKLRESKKTNSKNSSLPPSKDKHSKNKSNVRRNALRRKNKKKRGGQPGHFKHERKLLAIDQVDHIVVCNPDKFCMRGNRTKLYRDFCRHQKYEFPIIKTEVGVHADETGFKEQGKKMWAWVAIYTLAAVFIIRKGRTKKVAQELLGESFAGILCSDRFSAYDWLPLLQRQLCWAHLERDFRKISERVGVSQLIGTALLVQTNKLFHQWHLFKEGAYNREQLKKRTKLIRLKIEHYLRRGMLSKNHISNFKNNKMNLIPSP